MSERIARLAALGAFAIGTSACRAGVDIEATQTQQWDWVEGTATQLVLSRTPTPTITPTPTPDMTMVAEVNNRVIRALAASTGTQMRTNTIATATQVAKIHAQQVRNERSKDMLVKGALATAILGGAGYIVNRRMRVGRKK